MIGHISGKIIDTISDHSLIIEVSGIGYLVTVTENFFQNHSSDDKIQLYIHTHVKEDQLKLFGFSNKTELALFEKLISVSGVGPRTAMGILNIPLDLLVDALRSENLTALTQVPGLGKKTAEKIVIDMRSYFDKADISLVDSKSSINTGNNDALSALIQLGYERSEVIELLRQAPTDLSPEELVKFVLRGGK